MTHKKFIIALVLISSASFALGALLVIPSPFDAVQAYERNEASLKVTKVTVTTATSQPETQLTSTSDTAPSTQEIAENEAELVTLPTEVQAPSSAEITDVNEITPGVFEVPFFSQLKDITSNSWKKVGCGIASLAMLIEFNEPGSLVSVDALLQEGIDARAYLDDAGWTYAGLIGVSNKYGLTGETHDYRTSEMSAAFSNLQTALKKGPVMASVHYTFQSSNPIPHLVVITGITDTTVFYNDPAEETGGGSITTEQFKSAWKKRYIAFYPTS